MSPKETVKAFIAAHNNHDIEKMMSYLAEDSVMLDVASPIPLDSKKDVAKLYSLIFAAMPDIHATQPTKSPKANASTIGKSPSVTRFSSSGFPPKKERGSTGKSIAGISPPANCSESALTR